jgi:hypothetical protein
MPRLCTSHPAARPPARLAAQPPTWELPLRWCVLQGTIFAPPWARGSMHSPVALFLSTPLRLDARIMLIQQSGYT